MGIKSGDYSLWVFTFLKDLLTLRCNSMIFLNKYFKNWWIWKWKSVYHYLDFDLNCKDIFKIIINWIINALAKMYILCAVWLPVFIHALCQYKIWMHLSSYQYVQVFFFNPSCCFNLLTFGLSVRCGEGSLRLKLRTHTDACWKAFSRPSRPDVPTDLSHEWTEQPHV